MPLILASTSPIRLHLLQAAKVALSVQPAHINEGAIRSSLQAQNATPGAIAMHLAEAKARKISEQNPNDLVLGCDQVLDFQGSTFAKAASPAEARTQLRALRGKTHTLLSAATLFHHSQPVWSHIGEVHLTMRALSDAYLDDYITRNWTSVQHSVGCYKLEEEGARLFLAIEGDYFTVLGLPLLPLLGYLGERGIIPS